MLWYFKWQSCENLFAFSTVTIKVFYWMNQCRFKFLTFSHFIYFSSTTIRQSWWGFWGNSAQIYFTDTKQWNGIIICKTELILYIVEYKMVSWPKIAKWKKDMVVSCHVDTVMCLTAIPHTFNESGIKSDTLFCSFEKSDWMATASNPICCIYLYQQK